MKYGRGGLDGTPEEIRDFFENTGLKLADYLEAPDVKLQKRWLGIPVAIIAFALFLMIFVGGLSHKELIAFFVLGFGGGTWLVVSVQIRFRNAVATLATAVGVLLALLVAAGLIAPQETVEYIQKLKRGQ